MQPKRKYDPIVTELLRNTAESVADQMALTVVRTARATLVKENMDFSTALCDADGEVVAQGLCQPRHMCAIPTAVEALQARYAGKYAPGDIYILNDPYEGGTHLPDVYLFKPVFLEDGTHVGFACAVVHHTDIGGSVAGGNASTSTEIYQEGLRIPPLKLYDRGQPNETLFRILEKNVRVPDKLLGDLAAQVSACRTGEQGLVALARQYGPERLRGLLKDLLDYAEEVARAEIRALPEGSWEFTDYIDDDGFDPGPIPIHAKVTKQGDRITVDFTGTSKQVRGAINSTRSYTRSICYACVRSILSSAIPNNAGFFRPVEVITPEGSFVNPLLPGPVAARGLAGMRITEAVFGALAQMVPDRLPACEAGLDTGVTIAGYHPDRKPFVFMEFLYVSWGGGPDRDGNDAATSPHSNYSNVPVEVAEHEQPLMIEAYGFVPDSGGAGKYRGGLALQRRYRLLAEEAILQLRTDRQKVMPYGLWGGKPGTPSHNVMNPETSPTVPPSKGLLRIKRGDVFHHVTAGAGGWGDPLERDPEAVLRDVRNGVLTADYARREYGVVVDPATLELDWEGTRRVRGEMRSLR
ncbi:MAG: hydantoinase B/oxoprolinase family protein [Chloroflexi bacterium]|nr:hydantoinase B/oxoprolinase family protein [Chloroflexota bacterium]